MDKINILLIKYKSISLILIIIYIFISYKVLNPGIVYALEGRDIDNVMIVCNGVANKKLSGEQIENLLHNINKIKNLKDLQEMQRVITIVAYQYKVDINEYLIPALQYVITDSGEYIEKINPALGALSDVLVLMTVLAILYQIIGRYYGIL